jgi:hypothetical protein
MIESYDDWLRDWNRRDREAWAEYRRWEDIHFPISTTNPFTFPRGMFAARRAFEREQEIAKAREILKRRERSRVKLRG